MIKAIIIKWNNKSHKTSTNLQIAVVHLSASETKWVLLKTARRHLVWLTKQGELTVGIV